MTPAPSGRAHDTAPRGDLSTFTVAPFVHDGVSHDVYRKGAGPAVVVIPEIPGLTPMVLGFADRVVALLRARRADPGSARRLGFDGRGRLAAQGDDLGAASLPRDRSPNGADGDGSGAGVGRRERTTSGRAVGRRPGRAGVRRSGTRRRPPHHLPSCHQEWRAGEDVDQPEHPLHAVGGR